jgi:hypothetical protein
MRRAVVLAVLAAAAFAGYRYYTARYAPERVYRAFAEHVAWQRYDDAVKLCDGLTADDLKKAGTQEQIGAGPAMFQTLFPSRFEIQSRESAGDDVTLHAIQTVLFNPVGIESAVRPAMYATMNQVVRLRRIEGTWKVASFENTFGTMDSMRKP